MHVWRAGLKIRNVNPDHRHQTNSERSKRNVRHMWKGTSGIRRGGKGQDRWAPYGILQKVEQQIQHDDRERHG